MKKINFKNLPDTSTPLSAENMNLLQSNIEESIYEIKDNYILARPVEEETILKGYVVVPLQVDKNTSPSDFQIENGEIKCLRDGTIEISAIISFTNLAKTGVKWLEIRKNNDNPILQAPQYCEARSVISASPMIYDIKANEKLTLKVEADEGDQLRGDVAYSRVLVKYLD